MKKKILSLVLVVAMLTSMLVLAPVAGATEAEATVEVSDVVGFAGDTVTVDVKVTSASEIFGGQFAFDYDASKLKLESIAWAVSVDAGNASNKDGNTFKEVTHAGPYDVFNPLWTTALDVSEGVVIAKMTFTILANTLGTAEVSVRNLQRADGYEITRIYTSGDAKNYITDVECVAGTVTVLPAGYSTESTIVIHEITQEEFADDSIISYEYNGEGIVITKYNGVSTPGAILVIPSQFDDTDRNCDVCGLVDVVGIASKAFTTRKEAAIVIPETVTEIAPAAFFNCTYPDYYVLNPDCEIAVAALGAFGNYDGTQWTKGPWVKGDTATGKAPTIHGVAGSTAEAYAAQVYEVKNGFSTFNYSSDVNLPAEYTLTFNGTSFYFQSGATVTLPGTMETADGLAVAWTIDGTNYAAGSKFTITEDITLTPVTIQKPKTSSALGFKVTDSAATTAMRFTTDMAVADYNTLAGLGEVTMGTIITPARYVSKAGALTKEALNNLSTANGGKTTYIDVATEGYFAIDEAKTTYTFAGSIKGFKSANVALDYAAAFYLTVKTADGATFTVYSDFVLENNRNLTDAAAAVAAAGVGLTDAQKLFLEGLVEAIKNPQA